MAIYHLSVKIVSRSSGKSAIAAISYRSGQKLYDERQDRTFDYSKKSDVIYSEIMTPENAPAWMSDRQQLWNGVEAAEKRKDAQLAREVEVALPKELNGMQQIDLVREFTQNNFVKMGMVADINIHESAENPHAHILLTTRPIEGDGFGKKDPSWNKKEHVLNWRQNWAETANHHLVLNGHAVTIDHRSYADQGIDLEGNIHLGPIEKIEKTEPEKVSDLDRVLEYQRIARENGERIKQDPAIALDAISRTRSVFTQNDIYRFANTHSADQDQFNEVSQAIFKSHDLVEIAKGKDGKTRYSTVDAIRMEKDTLSAAKDMAARTDHRVKDKYLDQARATRTLTEEQDKAFAHILQSGDMAVVVGYAGTGKSYLLGAVREAYEAQGFTVKGAALAGIASDNLFKESGIESNTIAKRLYEIEQGRGLLTAKDILVIDEAGMVGTRQMNGLIAHAQEKGAKVVLIGDNEQLQAIEAGAPFRGIYEQVKGARLEDVRRQTLSWAQEATKMMEGDQTSAALEIYREKGQINAFETQNQAKAQLVKDWAADQRFTRSRNILNNNSMMMAYRNVDVMDLNRAGREEAKAFGMVAQKDHIFETVKGDLPFAHGDRIMFLKKERSLGIQNGNIGSIEKIAGNDILVKLDDGRQVAFDASMYKDFNHGYASTVHKLQGSTIRNSYVLADTFYDKHVTLTALSRHKNWGRLYWSKETFKDFDQVKKILSRERPKELIADYSRNRGLDPLPYKNRPEMAPDHAFKDLENQELEKFKTDINLSEYAASKGYRLDEKASFKNVAVMRTHDDKINISRDKDGHYVFYSWYTGKGGSIVDFIQQRTGNNLGEVRKELRPFVTEDPSRRTEIAHNPRFDYQQEITPSIGKDLKITQDYYTGLKPTTDLKYLKNRHITPETLADKRFADQVFTDRYHNAVFVHTNQDGLCGIERKNVDFTGMVKGGDKGLWKSNAFETDNKLVITEAPIDALSYHQIKGDEHTRYISFSGKMNQAQLALIGHAILDMPRNTQVIIATDKDPDGFIYADQIKSIARKAGIAAITDFPEAGKDWNEYLQIKAPAMNRDQAIGRLSAWNRERKQGIESTMDKSHAWLDARHQLEKDLGLELEYIHPDKKRVIHGKFKGTFTLDDEIMGVVADKNKDTGYMIPFDKDDKDHFKYLKDKDVRLELDQNKKHMEMSRPDKHLGRDMEMSLER